MNPTGHSTADAIFTYLMLGLHAVWLIVVLWIVCGRRKKTEVKPQYYRFHDINKGETRVFKVPGEARYLRPLVGPEGVCGVEWKEYEGDRWAKITEFRVEPFFNVPQDRLHETTFKVL